MNRFSYIDVASVEEALPLLTPETRPLAGGTDLLPMMKEGIAKPPTLVNLKQADELRFLHVADDGLHIGALITLDELDRSTIVRSRYPALSDAANRAASPQLRNMATIGGNLLQQVRCWYYRGDFHCWMKGGSECQARDGENQYHAIFDQSPCVAVHPSDPPVALLALDARLRIVGTAGARTVALHEFLRPPDEERRLLHTLAPDELIAEIVVPPAGGRNVYLKAMERSHWAFALASVAVAAQVDGATVSDVRIVLGGVSNVPVRAAVAEALVEGQPLDEALVRRAGEVAVASAQPLEHNGYKVPLLRNLVTQALRDLAGISS